MSGTYKSMYDEFKADNASQFKPVAATDLISFSEFKKCAPFNVKQARHESCLCNYCSPYTQML